MATIFESISLNGLRLAHLRQLQSYVHSRDESGWYYGPKAQFEKRHLELIQWIDAAVEADVALCQECGEKLGSNFMHCDDCLFDERTA